MAEYSDGEENGATAKIAEATEYIDDDIVDENVNPASASEHAAAEEHALDKDHIDVPNREDDTKSPIQIFQITISLRDDWLHRGDALHDMDLHTYAEFIERKAKPIRGTNTKKMLEEPIVAFEAHYKLAAGFVQVFRPSHRRCLARFNAPNCLRENVNEGEENAQFKAFHCSLIRCPGVWYVC